METAATLVAEGAAALARGGVAAPQPDAELLLAHVLGVERASLHAFAAEEIPDRAIASYRALLARRAAREPLQYITGIQEFWSLEFRVTPAVLIPRPETELLLDSLLRLNRRPDPSIVDVGTGSGCIAVALARELPEARIVATDRSPQALEIALANARAHGVASRIRFAVGDLYRPLRDDDAAPRYDFILSNPPYIGEAELQTLDPEVRDHEPRLALSPGGDPLAIHRRLAAGAESWLRPHGHLIVEIGLGQDDRLRRLYDAVPGLEVVETRNDLAGIPRALIARAVPITPAR